MISSEIWNDCFIENIGNDLFEDNLEDSTSEFQKPAEKSYTHFIVELPLGEKIDIRLESYKTSSRDLVGLQLWRGAFLLADFICANPELFRMKNVLELAAGTGFTSVIVSKWANAVICSDIDMGNVLELITTNFLLNLEQINAKYLVKEIDFFKDDWKTDLSEELCKIDTILVADVIYNEEITNAFMDVLQILVDLFCQNGVVIYVALEKRLWTNNEGQIITPSFDIFSKRLKKFVQNNSQKCCSASQLPLNFPHIFKDYYARVEELVLFKIDCKKSM